MKCISSSKSSSQSKLVAKPNDLFAQNKQCWQHCNVSALTFQNSQTPKQTSNLESKWNQQQKNNYKQLNHNFNFTPSNGFHYYCHTFNENYALQVLKYITIINRDVVSIFSPQCTPEQKFF